MKKIFNNFLAMGLIATSMFSCTESGMNENTESARLVVKMIDAPGDYEEVNVDIQDIQINNSEEEEGWASLDTIESGVYDLLTLTGGAEALLADNELPAGPLSQIRLILGDKNSLKVDGETLPLTVPSGSQSGLKLAVNQTLEAGVTYSILLDFDAAQSVVEAGNSGKYLLKPVIRTVLEATSGSIQGNVSPAEVSSAIYAIQAEDTLASSYTDESGDFLLQGVEAGTYTVTVDPGTSSEFEAQSFENQEVVTGEVLDMGTIEFTTATDTTSAQ